MIRVSLWLSIADHLALIHYHLTPLTNRVVLHILTICCIIRELAWCCITRKGIALINSLHWIAAFFCWGCHVLRLVIVRMDKLLAHIAQSKRPRIASFRLINLHGRLQVSFIHVIVLPVSCRWVILQEKGSMLRNVWLCFMHVQPFWRRRLRCKSRNRWSKRLTSHRHLHLQVYLRIGNFLIDQGCALDV